MNEPITFDGRVAVVTGAGGGLGKTYALELARRGARVVVNDLDQYEANATVEAIQGSGGEAIACVGDLTSPKFLMPISSSRAQGSSPSPRRWWWRLKALTSSS